MHQFHGVSRRFSTEEADDGKGPTEVFFFPASMVGAAMDDLDPPQSALKLPAPAPSPAREITVAAESPGGSLTSSSGGSAKEPDGFSEDDDYCIIDDLPGHGLVVGFL